MNTVSGYVWGDRNGDGYRQGGEGLGGVSLTLNSAHGLALASAALGQTTTNAWGYYFFDNVAPGLYTLTVVDPLGRVPSTAVSVDASKVDIQPARVDVMYYYMYLGQMYKGYMVP